jgi:hypothetical protein
MRGAKFAANNQDRPQETKVMAMVSSFATKLVPLKHYYTERKLRCSMV